MTRNVWTPEKGWSELDGKRFDWFKPNIDQIAGVDSPPVDKAVISKVVSLADDDQAWRRAAAIGVFFRHAEGNACLRAEEWARHMMDDVDLFADIVMGVVLHAQATYLKLLGLQEGLRSMWDDMKVRNQIPATMHGIALSIIESRELLEAALRVMNLSSPDLQVRDAVLAIDDRFMADPTLGEFYSKITPDAFLATTPSGTSEWWVLPLSPESNLGLRVVDDNTVLPA